MMRQDINEELEHLLEEPVKNHERIMQMLQPTQPAVVYKDYTGKQPSRVLDDTNGNGNGELPPLLSDEQIDVFAQVLAETRSQVRDEFQAMVADAVGPLTEAVAVLQGQVSVLMNLIGGRVNNNTVKEASETKTKTVRRVRQIESKPR
jgi:hypothetical protein